MRKLAVLVVAMVIMIIVLAGISLSSRNAVVASEEVAKQAVAPVVQQLAEGACPPAEQLGPWAPSSTGQGETFEVSAARGPVHLSVWWPDGNTPWGNQEVSVVLEPGVSIAVINGSGTAWDYPAECVRAEFERQVATYRVERQKWTKFAGAVELDELLSLGLVELRLPLVMAGATSVALAPTAESTAIAAAPTATSEPEVDCTAATQSHAPVVDQAWELGNADSVVIVHFWTNQPGHDQSERKLLLDHQTVGLLGGGSTWTFPAACQQVARDQFQADPMPEVSLDALLRQEGLAK